LPRTTKTQQDPKARAAGGAARKGTGAAATAKRADADGSATVDGRAPDDGERSDDARAEQDGADGGDAGDADGGDADGGRDGDGDGASDELAGDGDASTEVVDEEEAPASVPDGEVPESRGSIERFDALQTYLREVQRHPLLTPEQTHDLAVKFLEKQDPALARVLVTANLRLVVKIAYEYRRAYKNIMDLIQEGNIGLMQAVKRYDPYRGVKLSSYAAWWIRAYILRFILNNWRLVKLGTTQAQRKLFFNLRKKRAELQALGIDPTNAEIAKQLNVPEQDVEEMEVRLQASEKSLDAPVGDAEGRAIAKVDMMPSAAEGPETLMADSELQGLLKEKLAEFRKTLTGKDKDLAIFDQRLVADEPLTLQELGDRFGISRERVRQLEQRLTGRLREYLRSEMGDAVEVV
jgi:RNA polymerase sigma-32 factor